MNRTVKVKVEGEFACFSEVKANRKTYPVITPSAARNLVQAVFWKPEVQWEVRRISVLKPIRFITYMRNEVKVGVPISNPEPIDVSDYHTQVVSTVLKDVAYVIEVSASLTEKGRASGQTIEKYLSILERRVIKGQHFSVPYLGLREFTAVVSLATGDEQPIAQTEDFHTMTFDRYYPEDAAGRGEGDEWSKSRVFFYEARMVDGVIEVPSRRKVMKEYT